MADQSQQGSALFKMLADLASNPDKLKAFKDDPVSTMNEYGLDQEHQDLLHSGLRGNAHDYLKAVGDETLKHLGDFC